MDSFYNLTYVQMLIFVAAMFICVIGHTISMVFELYRFRRSRAAIIVDLALNVIYLCYLLIMLYKLSRVLYHMNTTIYSNEDRMIIQYILYVLLIILVIYKAVKFKRYKQFVDLYFITMSLSFIGELHSHSYVYIFVLIITYYYGRTIFIILRDIRDRRRYLSFESIGEAINALHTGVLFYEMDGFILICNKQMLSLMEKLSGKTYRNGLNFMKDIKTGEGLKGRIETKIDENYVYEADGLTWSFSESVINAGGKKYMQIAATDITELWMATGKLQKTREDLEKRANELEEAVDNIEQICLEEEMLHMKSTFHDVLGQRIAVLLRNLRENRDTDEEVLQSFAKSFYAELHEAEMVPAELRLDTIITMMKDIGIIVNVRGVLPTGHVIGNLFVDIIREAVTNAVRHGFAGTVEIEIKEFDERTEMSISNDGLIPEGDIVLSGGLKNIEEKLSAFDGRLYVKIDDKYTLNIEVPLLH